MEPAAKCQLGSAGVGVLQNLKHAKRRHARGPCRPEQGTKAQCQLLVQTSFGRPEHDAHRDLIRPRRPLLTSSKDSRRPPAAAE